MGGDGHGAEAGEARDFAARGRFEEVESLQKPYFFCSYLHGFVKNRGKWLPLQAAFRRLPRRVISRGEWLGCAIF